MGDNMVPTVKFGNRGLEQHEEIELSQSSEHTVGKCYWLLTCKRTRHGGGAMGLGMVVADELES